MRCESAQRDLYRLLDGQLTTRRRDALEAHLDQCAACREAATAIRRLHDALAQEAGRLEPSPAFDARFWRRVRAQAQEPWLTKLLKEWEALIPTPSIVQVCAVLAVALLIGGTGGAASAMTTLRTAEQAHTGRGLVHYLSGFPEFKGIPASSIAASYLKTLEPGDRR